MMCFSIRNSGAKPIGDGHPPSYFGAGVTVKIISVVKDYSFIVTLSEVCVQ